MLYLVHLLVCELSEAFAFVRFALTSFLKVNVANKRLQHVPTREINMYI
jgi:hypothetical protein